VRIPSVPSTKREGRLRVDMTRLPSPRRMAAICAFRPAGIDELRSLMGQGREALRGVDAFGCLRSLRARSALVGVSRVQRGLVEIAVGHRLTACYEIRAVVCSLPRASLLLGAGFGLLSRGLRGLGEREVRSVSQHRAHNDREATSQSDSRFAHR
jgi:hypothetical protein